MLYKLCSQGNDELFQNDMLRSAFRSLVSLASATHGLGDAIQLHEAQGKT